MTLKTIEKLFCRDPFISSRSFISSPICHTLKRGAFASHLGRGFPRQPQATASFTSPKNTTFQASTLSSPSLKIAEISCNSHGLTWSIPNKSSITSTYMKKPKSRYSSSKHLCASQAVCYSPLQLIGATLGVTPFYQPLTGVCYEDEVVI